MPPPFFGRRQGLALGVCLAMALAAAGSVASLRADDNAIDLANGWAALIIAIAAGHRLCFGRDHSFLGWLLIFAAFDLLALGELSGGRLELLEHRLHLQDFDDIGLLLTVLVALLVVFDRENPAGPQRRILVFGLVAHAASTAIDLCDDWLVQVRQLSGGDLDLFADVSEFVFLQLYMVGIVGHVVEKLAGGKHYEKPWTPHQPRR